MRYAPAMNHSARAEIAVLSQTPQNGTKLNVQCTALCKTRNPKKIPGCAQIPPVDLPGYVNVQNHGVENRG